MSKQPGTISGSAHNERDFSLFEQHESKLRQLFLQENKSLKQVKHEMEAYHGFPEIE